MPLPRTALLPLLALAFACGRAPSTDGSEASASPTSSAAADAAGSATLADLEREDLSAVSKAATRIATNGDAATKRAAVPILVKLVRSIGAKEWRDRKRPLVMEANRLSRIEPTEAQLEAQLGMYADEEIGRLLTPLAGMGGEEAIAFILEKAEDARASALLRKSAIAALTAYPPADPPSQERLRFAMAALATGESATTAPKTPLDPAEAKRTANVAVGGASVEGGAVENASAVVAGMAAGFRRCYVRALEEDASVKGTVKLTLTLDANGAVQSSTRETKLEGSTVLAGCVAGRAEAATFARPKSLPSSVVIPVTFFREK